jgi:hypothetical protein
MISILPLLLIPVLAQFGGRTELPVPEEDVATAVFVDTAVGTPATAITPSVAAKYLFRIENRWRDATNDAFLHTEHTATEGELQLARAGLIPWPAPERFDVEYGPAPEAWWSAYWELIPFDDLWDQYHLSQRRYYIRNRWTGRYANWSNPLDASEPIEDHSSFPSLQGFTLEPKVVDGVPCFRIRWGLEPQDYAQVHIEW